MYIYCRFMHDEKSMWKMSRYSTMMAGTRMANINLCCCVPVYWVRYFELVVALCKPESESALRREQFSSIQSGS